MRDCTHVLSRITTAKPSFLLKLAFHIYTPIGVVGKKSEPAWAHHRTNKLTAGKITGRKRV
jgi:hypothetical protein